MRQLVKNNAINVSYLKKLLSRIKINAYSSFMTRSKDTKNRLYKFLLLFFSHYIFYYRNLGLTLYPLIWPYPALRAYHINKAPISSHLWNFYVKLTCIVFQNLKIIDSVSKIFCFYSAKMRGNEFFFHDCASLICNNQALKLPIHLYPPA